MIFLTLYVYMVEILSISKGLCYSCSDLGYEEQIPRSIGTPEAFHSSLYISFNKTPAISLIPRQFQRSIATGCAGMEI